MKFGMSEKLGPRVLGRGHDQPFLGRDYGAEADYSEEIAREIDDEIRRVIEEAHELALHVLREHMDDLHKISGDPDRARDDRQGPVRAPARRRGRGGRSSPRRRRRGAAAASEEPKREPRAASAPVPAARARRCSRRRPNPRKG